MAWTVYLETDLESKAARRLTRLNDEPVQAADGPAAISAIAEQSGREGTHIALDDATFTWVRKHVRFRTRPILSDPPTPGA